MKRLLCFLGAQYSNVLLTLQTILLGVIASALYGLHKNGVAVNTQGSLELYEISRGVADVAENLEKISTRLEGVERELARLRPLVISRHQERASEIR